MAKKEDKYIGNFMIKFKGIFNFADLIKAITDWFESKGFEHYITLTKSKSTTFGMEEEVEVKGWYNEGDYYRIRIGVYVHLWDSNPVEVVQGGNKKMLTKARMQLDGTGSIEYDYTGRFSGSKFSIALRDFMDQYVLKPRYDTIVSDDQHYRVQALGEHIKRVLDMNSQGKYW